MRTCFFVATKTGTAQATLTGAPNLYYVQTEIEGKPVGKPLLAYLPGGDASKAVVALLHRVEQGATLPGQSGTWSVWLLMPENPGWDMGPRMMRKLIRARLGENILGPYTIPELTRVAPTLVDRWCNNGNLPHVIAGDNRSSMSAIDYAPTQAEADADTEPDPSIFTGAG